MSQREIDACLAGELSYDDLDESDQMAVRQAWAERMEETIESLDFEEEFRASGLRHSELDENGRVITWVVGDGHGGAVWKAVDRDGNVVRVDDT